MGLKRSGQDNWAHKARCKYQERCKLNYISVRGKVLVMEYADESKNRWNRYFLRFDISLHLQYIELHALVPYHKNTI